MPITKNILNKIAITITIITAIFTILGFCSTYIDPNIWGIAPFFSLLILLLLPIDLLLLIYWAFRKRLWLLVPLAVILLNIGFINLSFQFPHNTKSEIKDQKKLNILSYNVMNFHDSRGSSIEKIADFLRKQDADIVCFQEYCETNAVNLDSISKALIFLPYVRTSYTNITNYAKFGLAIFSKYPLTEPEEIIFSHLNSSMWADVIIDNDTIRIFNHHLQKTDVNEHKTDYYRQQSFGNSEGKFAALQGMARLLKENFQTRAYQVKRLQPVIEACPCPIIMCGDLNDIPQSYTYRQLRGDLNDGFETSGSGYAYTYRGFHSMLRIDYIFYSDYFQGICYKSPSYEWSDHNPVVMQLAF